MKKLTLIYIITLFLSLASCTQYHGHIDWFGTWRVESVTVDGDAAPDYAPPYMFWKFQSGIIQIVFPDDFEHTSTFCYGTWKEADNQLTVHFDWNLGTPPSFTYLDEVATLDIIKLSSSEIRLRYVNSGGHDVAYVLKKWG